MMLNRLYSCLSNIEAWVRHLAWNKMGTVVHVGSPTTVEVKAGWSESEVQGNSLLYSDISDSMEYRQSHHKQTDNTDKMKNTKY